MSGLFLAHHLAEAGIPYRIFEKRAAVGGTWHDNTYPGLHVDVITRSYEFPFARRNSWSKRYAPGEEIRRYLVGFARERGIQPNIRFNTEVRAATWNDGAWTLTHDGGTEDFDVVVAATGFLHVPKRPAFPGTDTFAGASFHSSEWNHAVELDGKRIGVVGTGSSGIQIVSELGKRGHDVKHFIRTPQWIQIKENPKISAIERLLLRVPALAGYWDRRMARLRLTTDGSETWRLVPGREREEMNERFLRSLREEIPDPALREKFTPKEPLGCKRIPKSPDYYRVVQLPNVEPVFGGVGRVQPEGIVDQDGKLHELDVIVYATGFDTHAYMRPMNVVGPGGKTVESVWNEGVYSYRGVALPHMPNFFLLNGPFAPVNSIAIPTCLRDEVGFLIRLLRVIAEDRHALAPTERATREFCDTVRAALPDTTYSLCDNWYTDQGGTPIIWPFTRQRHVDQYATLDLAHFDRYPARSGDVLAQSSAGDPA
ncbi:NAD(P)/FAD-dependent oxidoreductase [Dactylosporangium sp. AC04546]|uniref:flavin-containing monooxygenase n=1 Tax=Dactylosporangium sp. AC04546 TaxID=2862460 RepID=UPI001EE00ABF|nr:NAD(P)/FAD-dependent oxidoreductase [Dactylosporangium sp. AC04546]WVK80768.1 NAD(P)/FAD-dependent oxidoreductase [Dactylosporangium sp. AC04546]